MLSFVQSQAQTLAADKEALAPQVLACMLSRVSSLVRVDSAKQSLTPNLEVESVSFSRIFLLARRSSVSLPGRSRTKKGEGQASTYAPASRSRQGQQVQESSRGKAELPGAATLDKSLHLSLHAFSYGLWNTKTSLPLKTYRAL